MSSSKKSKVIEDIGNEIRKTSAQSVLVSHIIAEKIGMNSTDMECFDLLSMYGPLTAGKLAELTGLTTGAVTSMIDRLVKAKFVRRESDPKDRRKVVVVPALSKSKMSKIMHHYQPLVEVINTICNGFTTNELHTVLKFMQQTQYVMQEALNQIKNSKK